MGFGKQLLGAWEYSKLSGGIWRRIMTLSLRALLKVEEDLTDIYYRKHGLWTAASFTIDLYGAHSERLGYQPFPWRSLREMFGSWSITANDVLVDYGSGKGRTVIWAAANYRFRRVTGVELDRELHNTAQANLKRWSGRLLCDRVQFICADATELDVPDDVTIVYLFNPFIGSVFEEMVRKIHESIMRNPRELVIFYANPLMHDYLIKAGFSVERQKSFLLNRWAIYRLRECVA